MAYDFIKNNFIWIIKMTTDVKYLSPCKTEDTCINGIPCLNGTCSTVCNVSTDCLGWGPAGGNVQCLNHICSPAGEQPDGGNCNLSTDCMGWGRGTGGYGVQCLNGKCTPAGEQPVEGECTLATDCKGWGGGIGGVNATCDAGKCKILPAKFIGPNIGCLGDDKLTSYVCNANGDPGAACGPDSLASPTGLPTEPVISWLNCALGSSPGGTTAGRSASTCLDPYTSTFGCAIGSECYAITNIDKNNAECIASNPATVIKDIGKTYLGFFQGINGILSGTGDALSQPYIWIAAAVIGLVVLLIYLNK